MTQILFEFLRAAAEFNAVFRHAQLKALFYAAVLAAVPCANVNLAVAAEHTVTFVMLITVRI